MKNSIKWLIATYVWSGVAFVMGIFNVSYDHYGRYWWAIAIMLLLGLLISVIKEK